MRIPVLVVPHGDMDFRTKTFDEPKVLQCSNCGGSLFYCVQRYGLYYRSDWLDDISVVGETPESKKYRPWSIDAISEQRFCAVCKNSEGFIDLFDRDDIAHTFENDWDVEEYDKALDLIKYPSDSKTESYHRYHPLIEEIKKWISDCESRKNRKVKKNGK